MYAVAANQANAVKELLEMLKRDVKDKDEYSRISESRIRDEGYVTLGIPGGTTTLSAAMMLASPKIVSMLLEHGANADKVDTMGSDPFLQASLFGRADNLQYWLQTFKDWDVNKVDIRFGGCAMNKALFMGANKLETVKVLLDAGANLNYRTFSGSSALINAIDNEDSDPEVVKLILKKVKSECEENLSKVHKHVNFKSKSRTLKWKSIYFVAKVLYRTGMAKKGLMRSIALWSGTTPLNYAVMRGDVEIVKILLENGANPFVQNDLGMNAFEICDCCGPYPSVKSILLKNSLKE